MARIFYRTDTGSIYGVHPGAFNGALPTDLDFIDVPETPDQIAWPDARGEKFASVQGGVLVAFGPPAPEPRATGAQMIDEADARGKLDTLLAALSEPQRARFYTRRRITAGDDLAEALRAKLNIGVVAMQNFVAAAANRAEE